MLIIGVDRDGVLLGARVISHAETPSLGDKIELGKSDIEPGQPLWLTVEVPEGSTAQQAIELSGILSRCPQLNLKKQKIGIFGKITKLTAPLDEGDRVEIYRPITADPKTVPQRKIALPDDGEDDD